MLHLTYLKALVAQDGSVNKKMTEKFHLVYFFVLSLEREREIESEKTHTAACSQ